MISEISEKEIKAMYKEQNYIRGYKDGYIHGHKNGKSNVLDKIRAEIEEKYGDYDICEWFNNYDYEENDISEHQLVGKVSDILKIIDRYKAESEDKE